MTLLRSGSGTLLVTLTLRVGVTGPEDVGEAASTGRAGDPSDCVGAVAVCSSSVVCVPTSERDRFSLIGYVGCVTDRLTDAPVLISRSLACKGYKYV